MRIRNKKGQAEYVAYILLIGLGVALAVIVGRWSIKIAKQKKIKNLEILSRLIGRT